MDSRKLERLAKFSAVGGLVGAGVWALSRRKSEADGQSDSPASGPTTSVSYPPRAEHILPHSTEKPIEINGIPTNQADREKFILDAVKNRKNDPIHWSTLYSEANGHTAVFFVMADALKINGVRVSASARTEQLVADMLAASLLTPRLADLIFEQAAVRLPVLPRKITSSTEDMIDQSARVDRAVLAATQGQPVPPGTLLANVGKHWVITQRLSETPKDPFCHIGASNMPVPSPRDRAANYGWHFIGDTSVAKRAPGNTDTQNWMIDGKKVGVEQPVGICHDISHSDYSQVIVLVKSACFVDNEPANLQQVLLNPEYAPLANTWGVLRDLRLLGVPPVPAIV